MCLHKFLQEERDRVARSETIAIRLSNIANIVLFIAKVYASIRSGSLAIIASTLDSLLDLLSGFILWFTAFKMQSPNPYLYPIGKKRMQPLVSSLYFSFLTFIFGHSSASIFHFTTTVIAVIVQIFACLQYVLLL
jgi:divalent metal cation (Fe/Co/Zn/Cd) transporter